MQKVEKKKRPARARSRWVLLSVAAAVLAVCCGMYAWASRPVAPDLEDYQPLGGELINREAADVMRLRVTLRSGDSWSAVQTEPGILMVEGADAFAATSALAEPLLDAARIIAYEDVFTDDPALYRDRLAEFGLEKPRAVAEITYTDGTVCTLRLGEPYEAEGGRVYYMTVDGDNRLFALDRGTAEILATERALLYPVTQPILHKARFDRITLTGADGAVQAAWELQGGIGSNAADRWLLTEPVRYAADGESMASLLSNLANLRLGAYVGEATPENLTRCGFDAPCFTVTIHQAAGTIGTTDEEGRYGATDWPESTVTFVVGGAKNDSVDYVLTEGRIYISSHYSLQTLMDMDPQNTVSRYPAPVALGNLARLTVEKGGAQAAYVLTRESKAGSDAVPEGEAAVEVTCTLNGTEIPYAGFEAAYNRLLTATVSGRLPAGWAAAEAPHTRFTFEEITGTVHTVDLSPFDALHDAVTVDGYAMFYIIRGGFELGLTQE